MNKEDNESMLLEIVEEKAKLDIEYKAKRIVTESLIDRVTELEAKIQILEDTLEILMGTQK